MGFIWVNRVSQKRSTCCGTSSSSAASLMVRNASGDFSTMLHPLWRDSLPPSVLVVTAFQAIDHVLHHLARPENQHPPRRDGHFLAGLRVSAHAPVLAADHEGAERRQ